MLCYVTLNIVSLHLAQIMNDVGREVLFTQDFSNHREELGIVPVSYTHLTLPTICSV